MTGYEPIPLRKMMRERLWLFTRALNTKGKTKETYKELLTDKESKIKSYVECHREIKPTWRNRALETIKKTKESLK